MLNGKSLPSSHLLTLVFFQEVVSNSTCLLSVFINRMLIVCQHSARWQKKTAIFTDSVSSFSHLFALLWKLFKKWRIFFLFQIETRVECQVKMKSKTDSDRRSQKNKQHFFMSLPTDGVGFFVTSCNSSL